MQYPTPVLMAILAFSSLVAAHSMPPKIPRFSLIEKFPINGCYLNVYDVCGDCNTQLKVGATSSCNELHPGIFKWNVCGGELQLNTQIKLYPVSFTKGSCKQDCQLVNGNNDFLLKGKYAGAECEYGP
ncbi:MAG: hypothetical protein Q9218_003537 [Villophora microphyllina]